MEEEKYNIVIAGGGPAGISTWLYLNRYNPKLASKTLLIEKEIYPREKLCGGALGGWTEQVLKHLNLNINIPSIEINNLELRLGEEIVNVKEKKIFRIVNRTEFDHQLVKAAIKQGLEVKEGEYFQNFERKNNEIMCITNKSKYKVNVLIGADGANSLVRSKMKLKTKPNLAPGIEVYAHANPQSDPEFYNNKAVIDFSFLNQGLQGYIWHFPCIIDEKPSMNHGIIDFNIFHKKTKVNLKEVLKTELKTRNIPYSKNSFRGHPITWITENNILHEPNILLVGDAAGIEPAIGGGIHLSFSYGQMAAKKISKGFEKKNFYFKDYEFSIKNNILGKYIFRMGNIAGKMYSDHTKTLSYAKDIFDKNKWDKFFKNNDQK